MHGSKSTEWMMEMGELWGVCGRSWGRMACTLEIAGVSTIALSPHLIPEVQRGGVGWILSLFRHRPQGRKGVPGQMATAEARVEREPP